MTGRKSKATASAEQAEAMSLAAETLMANARAYCTRVGLTEADGIAVLMHAVGMAIADAAGPGADRLRLEEGAHMAGVHISRCITLYHRDRTIPNAGGARG